MINVNFNKELSSVDNACLLFDKINDGADVNSALLGVLAEYSRLAEFLGIKDLVIDGTPSILLRQKSEYPVLTKMLKATKMPLESMTHNLSAVDKDSEATLFAYAMANMCFKQAGLCTRDNFNNMVQTYDDVVDALVEGAYIDFELTSDEVAPTAFYEWLAFCLNKGKLFLPSESFDDDFGGFDDDNVFGDDSDESFDSDFDEDENSTSEEPMSEEEPDMVRDDELLVENEPRGAEQPTTKAEDDEEPRFTALLDSSIKDIVRSMRSLLEACLLHPPVGVLAWDEKLTSFLAVKSVDNSPRMYLVGKNVVQTFGGGVYDILKSCGFPVTDLNAYNSKITWNKRDYLPTFWAYAVFGWFKDENNAWVKTFSVDTLLVGVERELKKLVYPALEQLDSNLVVNSREDQSTYVNTVRALLFEFSRVVRNTFILKEYNPRGTGVIVYNLASRNCTTDIVRCAVEANLARTGLKGETLPVAMPLCGGASRLITSGSFSTLDDGAVFKALVFAVDFMGYSSEILWGYKAIDALAECYDPKKPNTALSLDRMLVGRTLSTMDKTISMQADDNFAASIFAGSGAGKGVMTLSMLSALLSSGCGLVYLDKKPDMSVVMWNFENWLKSQGYIGKILSVDGSNDTFESGSVMQGGVNVPIPRHIKRCVGLDAFNARLSRFAEINMAIAENLFTSADAGTFAYIKALQLTVALSEMRAQNKMSKDVPLILVIDEVNSFNNVCHSPTLRKIANLITNFNSLLSMTDKKASSIGLTDELKEEASTLRSTLERIQAYLGTSFTDKPSSTGIHGEVGQAVTINLRKAKIKALVIGQILPPVEGLAKNTAKGLCGGESGFISTLVNSSQIRIIGSGMNANYVKMRDTVGASYLSSGVDDGNENALYKPVMRSSGYFGVSVDSGASFEITKTYLVLNDNDCVVADEDNYTTGEYTGGVLKRQKSDEIRKSIVYGDYYHKTENGYKKVDAIGFNGLVEHIASKFGTGGDTLTKLATSLTTCYDQLFDILKIPQSDGQSLASTFGYTTVEEYIYDCRFETFLNMTTLTGHNQAFSFRGAGTPQTTASMGERASVETEGTAFNEASGFNEEPIEPFDSLDDGFEESEATTQENTDTFADFRSDAGTSDEFAPITTGRHGQIGASNKGSTGGAGNTGGMNNAPTQFRSGYSTVYDKPVEFSSSYPFATFGRNGSAISGYNAIKLFTSDLVEQIKVAYGGLDRVNFFEVQGSGLIVINHVPFSPKISEEMIEMSPIDLQEPLRNGCLGGVFNFSALRQFINLSLLQIDDVNLIESRLRPELGLNPNKDLSCITRKIPSLKVFLINGNNVLDPREQEAVQHEEYCSNLGNVLGTAFGKVGTSVSPFMGKLWNSRGVKAMKAGLGWTVGIKAVTMAATLLGPWGLVFGAFTAASVIAASRKGTNQNKE